MLDHAYEAAVKAGKLEAETLHDFLGLLPTRRELLRILITNRERKKSISKRISNNILRFSKHLVNGIYYRLPRKLQFVVRALKKLERKVHKKLVCLEPMLKRRTGKMRFPNHGMGRYNGMPVKREFGLSFSNLKKQKYEFLASVDDPNAQNETKIEYINDCFDDIPRMEFGWRVKVSLIDNEPCTFDPVDDIDRRCVVTNNTETDTFQRRQTGENFRSAAPADCRVTYICDSNPNDLVSQAPTQAPTPASTLAPTPAPILVQTSTSQTILPQSTQAPAPQTTQAPIPQQPTQAPEGIRQPTQPTQPTRPTQPTPHLDFQPVYFAPSE